MKVYIGSDEMKGLGFHVTSGDIKDAATTPDKVLAPNVFYGNDGRQIGTMPNRGGMSAELPAGGSMTIPEGYHNGEGVVRAQDLASQTEGTAAAANIEAGYTAWVNGEMVEGSLVPREMVKTTWTNNVTDYLQPNTDRVLPSEVLGKDIVIIVGGKGVAFIFVGDKAYYNGNENSSMALDRNTGVWSSTVTQALSDRGRTYTIYAI